ncbi:hypothetical protein [Rummeliibacillus pycnus]|uniref:hypothetical protein n=1 Tax=Rummeliibacillus pycnus TaxID=101070 RepID=UPI003D2CED72
MVFVFIALVLSLALIPLVLVDMRIKVSETQFELAVRSLETSEEDLAEKRLRRKLILERYKTINWNTGFLKLKSSLIHATEITKKTLNNGYLFSIGVGKSMWNKMKVPNQEIKVKNSTRTNRSLKNPTTRSK